MAVSARFMASLRNHTSLFLTCTTFDGQVKIALSVPGKMFLDSSFALSIPVPPGVRENPIVSDIVFV